MIEPLNSGSAERPFKNRSTNQGCQNYLAENNPEQPRSNSGDQSKIKYWRGFEAYP
jgi:hypothetical protein